MPVMPRVSGCLTWPGSCGVRGRGAKSSRQMKAALSFFSEPYRGPVWYSNKTTMYSCTSHNISCWSEERLLCSHYPWTQIYTNCFYWNLFQLGLCVWIFFLVSISTNFSSRGSNDPHWNEPEVCTAESVCFNKASCGIRLSFCSLERYF